MPYVHADTGLPADDETIKRAIAASHAPIDPKSVGAAGIRSPEDVGQGLAGFAKQTAAPLAGLGAVGTALDIAEPELALPEIAALGLRAAVMGGTNVALNKTLPKEYGGEPDATVLGGFATGALPEIGAVAAPAAVKALANRRVEGAVQRGAEAATARLDPDALKPRELLMRPGIGAVPPNTGGNELTAAVNDTRAPVMQTITAARQKHGAPIGEAYRGLKDINEPISEQSAKELADDAAAVRGNLIAPAPKAQFALQKIQGFRPQGQEEIESLSKADLAKLPPDQQQYFSDLLGGKAVLEKPLPTLDELRDLRQQVNIALRGAKGGDVYALGALQDRLDQELLPHLPDNMSKLRENYAGFMDRWGYKKQAALQHLENSQEVADWTFKNPRKAHDLMSEAGPQQRGQMQQLFLQHIYGNIDPTAEGAVQAGQVRKKIAPFLDDPKTAKLIIGPKYRQVLGDMSVWPKFTKEFTERFTGKDPQFRKDFLAASKDVVLKTGGDPTAVAGRMIETIGGADPQFNEFLQSPEVQKMLPQLPDVPKKVTNGPGASRAIGYHSAMGAAGVLSGRPFAAAWNAGAIVAYMASRAMAGFALSSKLGIARPLLNALSQKSGVAAGRAATRAILNAVGQTVQQKENAPVDTGDE